LNFPQFSIIQQGWIYTDGYYEHNYFFGVKDSLVDILGEQQDDWREKWRERYPESFTQKVKRFFWPPKLLFKVPNAK